MCECEDPEKRDFEHVYIKTKLGLNLFSFSHYIFKGEQ